MLTDKEIVVLFETKLEQLEARGKVLYPTWNAACNAKREAEEEDEVNTIMIAALRAALKKRKIKKPKPKRKTKKRRRK